MASTSFPGAVALVLAHEGGFVDHAHDPGGATNLGITRATLEQARGGPASRAEVRRLSVGEAKTIYRRFYWDPIRADDLPAGLDLAVFDFAVHSGPGRSVKSLQAVLGVADARTRSSQGQAAAPKQTARGRKQG